MTSSAVRTPQPGTYQQLVGLGVQEPVLGAHLCYPVGMWARFVTTAALRLGRRLLGRSRLTDRLPLGAVRHAVLAVTESRVMVWESRIGTRGPELVGEIFSWPHTAVTLERKRHEIVTSWTDTDGDSTTSRLKVLRYRLATPDGELAVDVPAGRGPAAQLDRALVSAASAGA